MKTSCKSGNCIRVGEVRLLLDVGELDLEEQVAESHKRDGVEGVVDGVFSGVVEGLCDRWHSRRNSRMQTSRLTASSIADLNLMILSSSNTNVSGTLNAALDGRRIFANALKNIHASPGDPRGRPAK